ncbi:hypothetical protein CJ030_MR5G010166 [Morella rubra]|uniref:Uncharacterized protein n=1 Tax=Morella rubra TaxID=262757 RepID=A0A6A1VLW6_9ROSI|nr:hypothetical protein CJ030_MR5G010166 [Morella rubra]
MQATTLVKAQGKEEIVEHSKLEAKKFLLVGDEPNDESIEEVDKQEQSEVRGDNEEGSRKEDELSANMMNGLGESSLAEKGDHFTRRKIEEEKQSSNMVNKLEESSLVQCKAEVSNMEVSLLTNGETSHIINFEIVASLELVGEGSESLDVEITSGDQRKCPLLADGVGMEGSESLDMILGNAWLRSIDKVLVDYGTMAIFLIHGRVSRPVPVRTP